MCLVHQYQIVLISIPIVIVLFIKDLCQTSIGNKFGIFIYAKVFECCFPVLFYCRRIYNKNFCLIASILYQELLCNHGCNNSLTKTNDICKEKSIIPNELLISLHNCIHLVIILGISLRHIKRIVVICGQHTIREVFHKHFDVQIVWSDITF